MERLKIVIFHLKSYYSEATEEAEIENKEYIEFMVFQSMMESLVEYVGFTGVLHHAEFCKKTWRVCKELLKVMTI